MTGSGSSRIQTSDQTKLTRGLRSRHVELIAIGGAIGVGLFLGSAKVIQNAGPGLILGYAVGGLVIFFIMRALVLLSQKVATNDEENHLFGKIHTSAMGGWNGSAKIE